MTRRMVALTLALAATLAGCGQTGGSSSATSAAPSTTSSSVAAQAPSAATAAPADGDTTPGPEPVRTDLVGAKQVAWSDPRTVGPTSLLVSYTGSQCSGIRTAVKETPSTIYVAVFEGTLPEAVGKPCPDMAVFGRAFVRTTAPVGHRAIKPWTDAPAKAGH